ncbi:unnamed protein product [Medioppia subpectinata]|uniref:Uncharacterized protein n=1 Tax=Medioppia subpectinata TaxID=1979941 RepID=A0A7R9KW15_9ACAR|nr:unnamed protein product [Medioppia subpectinata]CAG2110881.1 unnamed protein product [Medioppia subpectinata]
MGDSFDDNINDLPFKLRFTSSQKLCKEVQKMIAERYDVLDKLANEYETIGQHKHILANIKSDLESCNQSLKQLRSLCQCQSDDDKTAVNKQLSAHEEALAKLVVKCDCIQTVKMVDIGVKRLPSNWRAAMLKIARDKAKKSFHDTNAAEEEAMDTDAKDDESLNNKNNEEMNEKMISTEAEEMSHQFEIDLERKIYETQTEELMAMVQMLVMRMKTMRARIDVSKQLIKVVLKMKREYESANSKLKEGMATCHCAEAGADDDPEFVTRMQDKKQLEESIESVSADLKYWEEQYAILKEAKNKADTTPEVKSEMNATVNTTTATTTVVEVANEEVVGGHHYHQSMASTSSQQSCMFAGQQPILGHSQGTANPAVIYLEGLVSHQQPTYIPASSIHQPIGVYPHTYSIGHPHHSYAHQAPDGSIQVYSTDISSHPGYIAYQ